MLPWCPLDSESTLLLSRKDSQAFEMKEREQDKQKIGLRGNRCYMAKIKKT
jgi:hypothetical protein